MDVVQSGLDREVEECGVAGDMGRAHADAPRRGVRLDSEPGAQEAIK